MKTKIKKGLALVVVNADYRTQTKLPSCIKDGIDMRSILESLGFDVVYAENADRNLIYEKIEYFIKTGDLYSTLLVYYSGHGVQIDGINYFVPIDFQYNDSKAILTGQYLVSVETVTDFMAEHPKKTNIMILDACRTYVSLAKNMGASGLAEMNAGNGTIIAFATAPNKVAGCINSGKENSYYTKALLRHIATPNVKIEEMFKYVRKEVSDMTNGEQVPWESTSLNSDFYFNTMSSDELNETIYQTIRNFNSAETLVILSKAYKMSISDLYRVYERQRSEKPGGIYITSDESFERMVLERILKYGFSFENYRWVYNGEAVHMGEFFHDYKLPISIN